MFSNPLGTRLVFVDSTGSRFLLEAAERRCSDIAPSEDIASFEEDVKNVLWDTAAYDRCLFAICTKKTVNYYAYFPFSLSQEHAIVCINAISIPATTSLLVLRNGTLIAAVGCFCVCS